MSTGNYKFFPFFLYLFTLTYTVQYGLISSPLSADEGLLFEEPFKKVQRDEPEEKLTIYFPKKSFLIVKPEQLKLQKFTELLLADQNKEIWIHAHSWDGGNENQELVLSEKRSLEISRFLQIHGVKENQIRRLFYGNTKPLDHGFTTTDQALLRRAELKITNRE
ncbi:OmpA family protein [Leptospira ilyithenensis]|uniref:OmpA family protein n=1 Tax=Leptospira ilyithenensis TaxID=2484901 RepID=UPI0014384637|nr:OmpA family protein [Leptospira ilyithenensis]